MSEMELDEVLRALRRRADLSQRQLAERAGIPAAMVARIEAGRVRNPSFRTVERLVRAAGEVLGVGPWATGAPEPIPHEDLRDAADRRYPAHLDPIEVTRPEKWWGAWWTLTMAQSRWPTEKVPPYTYDRNRHWRDARRARLARGAEVAIHRVDPPDLDGRGWIWLAEPRAGDTTTRAGELRAHRDDDGSVVLDGVVVAAAWRGCGIGRRLVEALLAHADGAPVTTLTVDNAYREFLRACGFAREGPGWVAQPRRWPGRPR